MVPKISIRTEDGNETVRFTIEYEGEYLSFGIIKDKIGTMEQFVDIQSDYKTTIRRGWKDPYGRFSVEKGKFFTIDISKTLKNVEKARVMLTITLADEFVADGVDIRQRGGEYYLFYHYDEENGEFSPVANKISEKNDPYFDELFIRKSTINATKI